jgi:hypothetical protein
MEYESNIETNSNVIRSGPKCGVRGSWKPHPHTKRGEVQTRDKIEVTRDTSLSGQLPNGSDIKQNPA